MTDQLDLRELLYSVVPELYRQRDAGDLESYLCACGELLNRLQATIAQRLADNFPDNPTDGSPPCQDWLIPYFADLLDVRLVSPTADGRREEVAFAVRWRQGKGTLPTVEEIAESLLETEVVVHEGWQRVARTPRIGTPTVPATAFGYDRDAPSFPPSMAALHPGLPAVTVDLRRPSGAVAADPSNPAAQVSTVDGVTHRWRQASLHGSPCHPESYEDVTRRTPDLRTSDWRQGHFHPKRILLFAPPPAGFFPPNAPEVSWSVAPSASFLEHVEVVEGDNRTTYRARALGSDGFQPVRVLGAIDLAQVVPGGVGDANHHTWRFEGLVLEDALEADGGRVELEGCAAERIEVHSIDVEEPVITARNSLVNHLQAARGLSRLEYCTLLSGALTEVVQATDCVFLATIRKDHASPAPPDRGCLRLSALPLDQAAGGMQLFKTTRRAPVMHSTVFGERSAGVLHPATPEAVRHGAEDGGEMGAYHGAAHGQRREAALDKLNDFLPVGLRAAIRPDERLLEIPG